MKDEYKPELEKTRGAKIQEKQMIGNFQSGEDIAHVLAETMVVCTRASFKDMEIDWLAFVSF